MNTYFPLRVSWDREVPFNNGVLGVSGQASADNQPFDLYLHNYVG